MSFIVTPACDKGVAALPYWKTDAANITRYLPKRLVKLTDWRLAVALQSPLCYTD
ncbi:hypothetical protein HMPREF1619_04387 [Klebsiella pneumoniae 909957]|nr:hypothetical protein HMPREF1619_04387 [Klebsiella pneumoniae 909957]